MKSSTVVLFALAAAVVHGHQRKNRDQSDGDLICRVMVERTWRVNTWGQTVSEKKAACVPVLENGEEDVNTYELHLPQGLKAAHQQQIVQGSLYVKIPGGRIAQHHIEIPTTSEMVVLDNPRDQQYRPHGYNLPAFSLSRRRLQQQQQAVVGTKKLMVARVSLNDSQVEFAKTDLEEYIFGLSTTSVSVANQYAGCSSAKLTMVPSTLGGVVEIMVNRSVTEYSSWRVLRNDAATELKNFVGSAQLTSVADYVMLCLPPGSWNFMASTSAGYWRSAYDNKYCGYLSVAMHTLGYSMNLADSNDVKPLQDTTCYMGQYYAQVASPEKCYNAQKHWLLGWFSDKAITVNPTNTPQVFSLATFLDYKNAESTDAVILNVGNVYLQYNRAKGFNIGTGENKNQVVVVQADQATGESEKLGGLDMQSRSLVVANYGSGSNLLIELCQFNSTRLDIAMVSFTLGNCSCSCSTPAPSTMSTTGAPSSLGTTQAPSSLGTTQAPSSLGTTHAPSSAATTVAPSSLAKTLAPSSLATTIAPSIIKSTIGPSSAATTAVPLNSTTVAPSSSVTTPLNTTSTAPTPTIAPSGSLGSTSPTVPSTLNHTNSSTPSHSSSNVTRPTIFTHPSSMPTFKPSVLPLPANSTLSPKVNTLYPTAVHGALDPIQTSSSSTRGVSLVWIVLMGLGWLLI